MSVQDLLRQALDEISARDPALRDDLKRVRRKGAAPRKALESLGMQDEAAPRSVEALESLGVESSTALETIVLVRHRPVLAISKDKPRLALGEEDRKLWAERLKKAAAGLTAAIRAVGRIDLRGNDRFAWVGTGWLVADDIVVTNRHVALEFSRAGGKGFVFRQGMAGPMSASLDFLHEIDRKEARPFEVAEVLHIEDEPGPDVAFLRLASGKGLAKRIELAAALPKEGARVAVIGYPARDSRIPDQQLMQQIFGDVYDLKRLAPGMITGTEDGAVEHDCSTLGGNSGSVVLDLATGAAVALHFSGTFLRANYAVPAAEVKRVLERVKQGPRPKPARPVGDAARPDAPAVAAVPAVTIPLRLQIELAGFAAGGAAEAEEPVAEARPEDYSDRDGYQENFLGKGATKLVKLPEVQDQDDVLRFGDDEGEHVLKYRHFSVVMSKGRRMCHFSAVNIDGSKAGKVARGPWRWDARIPRSQQIMKECYGNPPKFSRGHMTRREDPVWGSKEDAVLGNADSMHVTNTVPQMQAFNAPIWLGLEDYALGHARKDGMRICVFTGPFFDDAQDPVLYGVRVPRSFWKVIAFVHDDTGKLCATGYRMSQEEELPAREFVYGEFTAGNGETTQVSLAEIERDAGLSFGKLTGLDPKRRAPELPGPPAPLRTFAEIVFV